MRTTPEYAPGRRIAIAAWAGPALLAFFVYLRTVQPSIPTGDSGELITAAWLFGVAHPPGYPLFTILGHLSTLLPFGSVAYRVNLMSAVFSAAAVGVAALWIRHLAEPTESISGAQPLARRAALAGAVLGSLVLAFSTPFWTYATVAEVFPLNSLLAALLLLLLLGWQRHPERWRLLSAAGLASGLAATNQQTIVLLAPALLLLLGFGANNLLAASGTIQRPVSALARNLGIALGLFVCGLLVYLYLPWAAARDPALNWGDPRTPEAFWLQVSRADYGTVNLVVSDQPAVTSAATQVLLLLRNLFEGFTPLGCLLVPIGGWWLWRHRRVEGVALGLAFLVSGPVFLAIANPPIQSPVFYGVLARFYILPGLVIAGVIGLGGAQLVCWMAGMRGRASPRLVPGLCVALLVIPIVLLAMHYAEVDQSANFVDRYWGEDMLAPMEPGALFLVTGDAATMAVDYMQLVEGYRSDLVSLNMEKLKLPTYVLQARRQHPEIIIPFQSYTAGSDHMARLVEANWAARPVYVLGLPDEPRFLERFDTQRDGFALRLLMPGSGTDPYSLVNQNLDLFKGAHYPPRRYPETTFESGIVQAYGALAFDVAYVLDDGVRDAQAMDFYRLAVDLDPANAPAYKNLGLLLFKRGESTARVISLWQEYLRLAPNDPEAPAIRTQLRAMGATG